MENEAMSIYFFIAGSLISLPIGFFFGLIVGGLNRMSKECDNEQTIL